VTDGFDKLQNGSKIKPRATTQPAPAQQQSAPPPPPPKPAPSP